MKRFLIDGPWAKLKGWNNLCTDLLIDYKLREFRGSLKIKTELGNQGVSGVCCNFEVDTIATTFLS